MIVVENPAKLMFSLMNLMNVLTENNNNSVLQLLSEVFLYKSKVASIIILWPSAIIQPFLTKSFNDY